MTRRTRRLTAAAAAACAFVVMAPSAGAYVLRLANGQLASVALRNGVEPASVRDSLAAAPAVRHAPTAAASLVGYHGGPVVHSSDPYLIFWAPSGESISSTTSSLLKRYFTDVAADSGKSSNVYGVDRQYSDAAGFADYRQTFSTAAQVIVDTQPYPAKDTANCPNTAVPSTDACITGQQLDTEVTRLIAADGLPSDGSTSAPELNPNAPIPFVVLPADVNVCLSSTTCEDGNLCAYHASFTSGGNWVLYAAIPLLSGEIFGGKSCQADGNAAVQKPNGDQVGDIAAKYLDHEDNETITDPLLNAWLDPTGAEIADKCNGITDNVNAFLPTLGGSASLGTLYNQVINGNHYYVQSEWSNGDSNCEMLPSPGTMTASLAGPTGVAPNDTPVSFTPTARSTNGYSSVTWSFGDGTGSFDNSGAGPASISHAYTQAGNYTITLTAVDRSGNVTSAQTKLTVVVPTISIKVSHKTHKGATIKVTVNVAGRVSGGGKHASASGPSTVKLKFKLSKAQRRRLAARGRLTVKLKIHLTPPGGFTLTHTVKLKF